MHMPEFYPFPGLSNPHLQTIIGRMVRFPLPLRLPWVLPSVTQRVLMSDNDQIALEVSTPEAWGSTSPTVLLLHGLGGSHEAAYLVRTGRCLIRLGYKVVRMNMRCCGSGKKLARKIPHGGRSDDVLQVVKELKTESPHSALTVVGYSLGGNIMLKFAGEGAERYVERVVAICPPVDLLACVRLLGLRRNRLYEQYYVKKLLAEVALRHKLYPDIPVVSLPQNLSLFEFDQVYLAPLSGFRDALDYYQKASAARLIPRISVDTRILFAADDPFVDWSSLQGFRLPENIQIEVTKHGGHMGFVGNPFYPGGYRWLDSLVVRWVTDRVDEIALNPPI